MHPDTLTKRLRSALRLSELVIKTDTNWGSLAPDNRRVIRQNLGDHTGYYFADLECIPVIPAHGLSISHNRARGGYALSSEATNLGFDMEITARVREDLLARVTVSTAERSRAPSAAALWTAKEAAYKCLHNLIQPRGLADIEIGNWIPLGKNIYQCELLSTHNRATGVVVEGAVEGETWSLFRGFTSEGEGLRDAMAVDR